LLVEEEIKTKPYDPSKPHSFTDLKGLFINLKAKFNQDKTMLIKMELNNGFHTQFIGFLKKDYFVYKKGTYVVEDEFKYYDLSASMWALDYHESFSLPIQRKLNITEIKRQIVGKGVTDIDRAINPKTLEQFIESQVIEKVMRGQELDNIFKFIKIMLIIVAIACVLHLMLFVKVSGLLDNVNLPF